MTRPSCSVISTQSPWHHTPGKRSKYAARYLRRPDRSRSPSASTETAIVQTSSPLARRTTGLPSSSKTSTSMPRPRHCSSPRHTGSVGAPSAKHDTMSVPPEIDDRQQVVLHALVDVVEALRRQRAAGREHRAHAAELEVLARDERDLLLRVDVLRRGAEVRHPLRVGQRPQSMRPRSTNGEPSYSSSVAPAARPDTSQFHIIQPQVVK